MKTARILVILGVIAVAAFAIWTFMGRSSGNGSGTAGRDAPLQVRIATFSNAVDYAPFYVARDRGFFTESFASVGAVPEYAKFEALAPINDSLAAGRLDLVFEAEPPAFVAEAAGTDVSIAFLSVSLTQNVIAHSDNSISGPADLSGRRIGVLTGTSSHYGLIRSLALAQLPAADVEIINLPPAEGRSAFRSGAIDAWAVWPPFPEVEELEQRAVEVPGTAATIHSLLVSRAAFSAESPEVVEAAVSALERAQAFIAAEPEAAMELVANAVDQPIEVVRMAWPKHDFSPELNDQVIADLQEKATFLNESGFIDVEIDVRSQLIASQ